MRKSGDILIKKQGGGFTSSVLKVKIPTLEEFKQAGFNYESAEEDYDSCLICSDPNCKEFANLLVLDDDNNIDLENWIFHVSECQLEDL